MRMRKRFGLPALGLCLGLSACGGGAIVQQGPSDTLRAYSRALEEGRVDDAYRLLSDDAKRSMSLEAFRRSVVENPLEVKEIAHALARPTADPVVTATVTMPNGDELLLVYEGGKWRVDAAAVDLYGQSTPRQALLGFLRAFERKRYDMVLRYVPDAEKEGTLGLEGRPQEPAATAEGTLPKDDGLTAEKLKAAWEGPQKEQITRIVVAVKAALPTAQIEETGDSAAMSYGAGGTVAFVREHGLWKIKDF
ncbi:MAG: hypothetical protein IPK82_36785 [Polyangiaceae bacterium]|nr:hypothetical protein [Polyangiaceae bacterium]